MFTNWKLGTKLFALYVIAFLALTLSTGLALVTMGNVSGQLIQILYVESYQISSLILRADKDLYQQLLNQRTIVLTEMPEEEYNKQMQHYKSNLINIRNRMLEGKEIFEKSRPKYEGILTEKTRKNVFDNLEDFFRQFDHWENQTTRLVEKVPTVPIKDRQKILNEIVTYDVQFEEARNTLKEIRYLMDSIAKEEVDNAHQITREARITVLLIALILFLTVFLLGWYVIRYMVRSINQIVHVSDLVSKGRLAVEHIEVKNNDEIGMLAQSVNTMTDNLRQLIHNASETAEMVAASSEQLLAAVEEGEFTADKIREGSKMVSEGSKRQNEMVTHTFEAIKYMSEGMAAIESNSHIVARSSEEALKASQDGYASAQNVVNQMKETNDAVKETSSIILQLGERSEEISKVIHTINEIATQTKLLALNAAIEAARAGEHGKGFAVVAEEVKKLAERSGDSTTIVADVITDIRHHTQHAVQAMKLATEKVHLGLVKSEQVIVVLEMIQTKATHVTEKVNGMYESLEHMKSESGNILKATEEVSKVVNDNTQSSLDNDKRINQQVSSVREISVSARSLSEIAERMDQLLNKFSK
ncbi:HAMP domain-containing protein [Paenibacillus sp. LMG 31456]|uniref:HAMP domain-containing protein n=1 Tax=Paenibacillus foliorum TaxID=2654974 RepID=A0A972GSF6_9BACL|nr:methyl-accepting chemotaxis protein [Paenibacillus foliorum]NOU93614.1 HAMP domain-containing protein [Paenibacillus foliorum]